MPLYNSEKFIAASIASVQAQTFTDWELIVVDDGSTDCSADIVQKIICHDDRIRLILQPNSGRPAVPRNIGLRAARGEFVAFLDSDDLYRSDRLERQLAVINLFPDFDVVFHDFVNTTVDGETYEESYLNASGFHQRAFAHMNRLAAGIYECKSDFYNFMTVDITSIHTSAILIRTSRLKKESVWFPEELTVGEDIDLWFRLVKCGRVAYLDKVLSYYRQYEGSITKNEEKMLKGFIAAHSRNYQRARNVLLLDEKKGCRRKISNEYFHLGYFYVVEKKYTDARRSYMKSLVWSFNLKSFFGLLKTFVKRAGIKLLPVQITITRVV